MVIVSNFKLTEMKSINIFFAALVLISAAVGCVKQENPTFESNGYKVEFNVADKAGFDVSTKAVKASWAAGDQIAIFCQPGATGNYFMDNTKTIYLKYDGTSWSVSSVSNELANELSTGGNFTAIHYRVSGSDNICFGASGDAAKTFITYKGGEILYYSGTYTKTDGIISFGTIAMGLFPDKSYGAGSLFQVSVKNLSAADNWKMAIANDNYEPSASAPDANDKLAHEGTYSNIFTFNSSTGNIGTWGSTYLKYRECACVQNGSDISFVFTYKYDKAANEANDTYHFYLTNGTDVYTYTVERGAHDGSNYAKKLEIGHSYLLPAITEEGKWVKQQ